MDKKCDRCAGEIESGDGGCVAHRGEEKPCDIGCCQPPPTTPIKREREESPMVPHRVYLIGGRRVAPPDDSDDEASENETWNSEAHLVKLAAMVNDAASRRAFLETSQKKEEVARRIVGLVCGDSIEKLSFDHMERTLKELERKIGSKEESDEESDE